MGSEEVHWRRGVVGGTCARRVARVAVVCGGDAHRDASGEVVEGIESALHGKALLGGGGKKGG